MLCCALLCCAALHCALLCCVVVSNALQSSECPSCLCCAVLCCAMLCCAMLCFTHRVLCQKSLCHMCSCIMQYCLVMLGWARLVANRYTQYNCQCVHWRIASCGKRSYNACLPSHVVQPREFCVSLQSEAKQSDFSATVQLELLGEVTVGVTRADGLKCARYCVQGFCCHWSFTSHGTVSHC